MQNPLNPVQQLLALHARGRFGEMEQEARQLLRGHGGVAILNELLGVALSAQKKFADALPYLQKAVRQEARDPLFWENLGLCQRELREFGHAEKSLRQALKLRPNSPESLNALGSVLREREQYEEARGLFEQVLTLVPDHGPAHFNLGRILVRQNDLAAAELHLRRAIAGGQETAIAYRYVGRVLNELEKFAEAELCFRRALALEPSDFINYAYLAHCSFQQRHIDPVAGLVRQAFDKLGDIGAALDAGRIDDLDQFSGLLCEIRMYSEAVRILEVTAYSPFGDRTRRFGASLFGVLNACSWKLAAEMEAELMKASDIETLMPFVSLPLVTATPAKQLEIATAFSAKFVTSERYFPSNPGARQRERLRIGYLSSDFHDHAVAFLLVGVLEAHDRSRFEVFGYDHARSSAGSYRDRIMGAFEHFVPLQGHSFQDAMQKIADDELDILIDLNAWTAESWTRLLAKRVAPLQLQWLGYAGTVGGGLDRLYRRRSPADPAGA